MARPDQFERALRRIGRNVQENASKVVRAAAVTADQVVVVSTPVDTGRARSNWLVGVDAAPAGTREPADKSGQAALDDGRRAIGTFDAAKNSSIHIVNNLDYIQELDRGSSAQAPNGMTARAIAAARSILRSARLLG
jgi:hypothetical protein